MKSIIIVIAFFFVSIFSNVDVCAKDVENPYVRSSSQSNITIKRVNVSRTHTQIDFLYKSDENMERYIFLSMNNPRKSMYIKKGNLSYKLLFTIGIANEDGITRCRFGQTLEFSAIFEAMPESTTEFDLLEGDLGDWNFYGIELNTNNPKQQELCQFHIINAFQGDRDITDFYRKNRGYLVIYSSDNELFLSNVSPGTDGQSWGRLIVEDYKVDRLASGDKDEFYYGKWSFSNTYDNELGVVSVTIGRRGLSNTASIQISTVGGVTSYLTEIRGNMEALQRWVKPKTIKQESNTPKQRNSPNILRKKRNFKIN